MRRMLKGDRSVNSCIYTSSARLTQPLALRNWSFRPVLSGLGGVGGSLPAFESLTSSWSQSSSSWTLLAIVAVVFLVVVTAGAFAVAAGATAGAFATVGPATFLSGLVAGAPALGGVVGMTAEAAAAAVAAGTMTAATAATAVAAGAALTASTVVGAAALEAGLVLAAGTTLGGMDPTSAINGPFLGATAGYSVPTTPNSDAGRSVYQGVIDNFDTPATSGLGVQAVTQALYGVNCAPSQDSSACASSGLVPRPDTGAVTNNVQFWQDNGRPMVVGNPILNNP